MHHRYQANPEKLPVTKRKSRFLSKSDLLVHQPRTTISFSISICRPPSFRELQLIPARVVTGLKNGQSIPTGDPHRSSCCGKVARLGKPHILLLYPTGDSTLIGKRMVRQDITQLLRGGIENPVPDCSMACHASRVAAAMAIAAGRAAVNTQGWDSGKANPLLWMQR